MIFELVKLRTWRDDIWMQVNGANVFRRVDQPGVQIEVNSSVAGWDDHTLFAQRVRNYTKKPIDLEIRRTFGGHVDLPQRTGGQDSTTSRRCSTRPRSSRARRPNCSMRSCSTKAATPSRTT